MNLIVVRHGEPDTAPGAQKIDPPLSARGLKQADLLVPAIQRIAPDVMISSGMQRAHQTGSPSAVALGQQIAIDPRVAEIDKGGRDYRGLDNIRAEGGDAMRQFLDNPFAGMADGGVEFRAQVLEGFGAIMAANRGKTVAVFCHGFPINLLLSRVLGVDLTTRVAPKHASITRFIGSTLDKIMLVGFNETAHLPDELTTGM